MLVTDIKCTQARKKMTLLIHLFDGNHKMIGIL